MKKSEEEILEIAKSIMRDSPGTTPQKALRHAKDIYRNRGRYKTMTEKKSTSEERTSRKDIPEHIRITIKRQKQAAAARKAEGRTLPTAHFISGGKVSPK